ncbi:8368_t:CDS:2, partial [Funneliformis geosporum]
MSLKIVFSEKNTYKNPQVEILQDKVFLNKTFQAEVPQDENEVPQDKVPQNDNEILQDNIPVDTIVHLENMLNKMSWTEVSTDSEWDLLKDLLQILGLFEEATRYLGGSYYSTHSFMYCVVKVLKGFFKLAIISNNGTCDLNFENELDAFNEHKEEQAVEPQVTKETSMNQQRQMKLNTSVNTAGLLNKVKKNIYISLCYNYPEPTSQEWISALLDPQCKSLDSLDITTRLMVKNTLRNLYKDEKVLKERQKEKEKKCEVLNLEIDEIDNF